MRSLYICYFGLREPLVQTQVLPYLRELTANGARVFLLTFEPRRRKNWDVASIAQWRERLRGEGIEWTMATYHKWPSLPATLYDIAAGAFLAAAIVRKHRIAIIHARSHVPAMMGALAKKLTRARLLFDIRGLMADEYAEAGNWTEDGWLYRWTKRVERFLFRTADAFVVLTERARRELFSAAETRPVEVVPCCIDPARMRAGEAERNRVREQLGVRDRVIIVYAGSLGGAYLAREMGEFFEAARAADPRVFPLVLTHSDPALITKHLRGDHHVGYVDPDTLPAYLAASDIALSIVKPGYSKIAMSPTKFAEYLAAGLPVISTRGIGDLDAQIEGERVGILLDGLDRESYGKAFDQAEALRRDPSLRERCARVAATLYDLHSVGGARYRRLYERLK